MILFFEFFDLLYVTYALLIVLVVSIVLAIRARPIRPTSFIITRRFIIRFAMFFSVSDSLF